VLVALSLETASATPARRDERPPPTGEAVEVLAALGWEATSVEHLVAATGLAPSRVALALVRLEQDGWARASGGWWERVAAP
jgi:predicted Rossmann fold nucleotide-binding protein DprA/Smf involved in DNA uptake